MCVYKGLPNVCAFLDMIAHSEGTSNLGDNGYNVLAGGGIFKSYLDHPRVIVKLNDRLFSTAAGRYQILERTYDNYAFKLRLHNFTPLSQDSIAIQLITETGAMPKIINGKLDEAIKLCSHLWASLPGNDYGQRMESSVNLHKYYFDAGGILA